MAEEPECQLRRRRSTGNPPLTLEVAYQVDEGGPSRGTPSPSHVKFIPNTKDASPSRALIEFRKKQQSFEVQVEDCEEEEIIIESDDEVEVEEMVSADRPVTPTPVQDFSGSVVYTEGPQATDFLKVKPYDTDCFTDVSDAETDEEEEEEEEE